MRFCANPTRGGSSCFERNVQNPQQVTDLVAEFRRIVGRADAPVLIDQEGGRVQRLGPPHWPKYPSGAAFKGLYDANQGLALATLIA